MVRFKGDSGLINLKQRTEHMALWLPGVDGPLTYTLVRHHRCNAVQ